MTVFQLIQSWIEYNTDSRGCSFNPDIPRDELEEWVAEESGIDINTDSHDDLAKLSLYVDCLIACGIGRPSEQMATIFVRATDLDGKVIV